MTQQIIDTGLVANDGTGESLRNAFTAVNNNFANIWAAGPVDTQVIIYSNVVSTNVTNLDLRLAGNGIGTITVESTMVPSIDRVYDLGSPTKKYDSVYAQYYFGNGAFLTGISGGNGSASNSFSTISANGVNIVAANATSTLTLVAGNNISIIGNSSTDTVSIGLVNNPTFSGNISTAGNIIGSNVNTVNLSLSGNVVSGLTVTGNVSAPYFLGNGSQLTGIIANLSGNLSGNINTGIYNLYSSNGAVKVDDTLSVTGTVITTGGILSGGPIATTANVTANYFIGDGSQLTNLPSGNYSNANVAAYLPTYTGNISAGNITTTGNISSAYVLGNGSQLTGVLTSLVGPLSGNIDTLEYSINSSNGEVRFGNTISVVGSAVITNDLLVGDQIATTANVTANYFIGDGSQLTNLPSGNYSNANVAAYLPTYTGNISANNFIGNGATLTSITGANVSGVVANAVYALNANSASYANNAVQANYAIVANSVAGANVSGVVANATYALNSNTSNYTNQANVSNIANSVAGANVSGTVANAVYALNANAATYATTAVNSSQANYANIANSVTGSNVVGIVANAAYAVTASSANTANTSGLAQYVTSNVQANITSLGVLTSLSSTGNITAPYFIGNGRQLTGVVTSIAGNLAGNIDTLEYSINSSNGEVRFGNSISVIGNAIVTNDLLVGDQIATTGNITTAANVYAANFIGNVYGNIFANILVPGANTDVLFNTNGEADATSGLTFNKVSNVLTVGGNVSAVGNVIGTYILGNGSQLTGLPELYGNANVADYLPVYTGNLASLQGDVTTTANVTANNFFGNTANIVGNITTSANVIASYFVGNFAGNISGNLTVPGANTQVIFNTDGSADATSGFTFDKLSNLVTVGGNVSANYFIGNGSQLTGIDATSIQNGNSNVKVYANSNVAVTVNNTSNVLVMANTGAYVTGIISATGNVIAGNISTAGVVTATGNITGGNVNTAGNVVGGNLNASGLSLSGNVLSALNSTSNITTTANVAAGGILTDNYYYANGTPVDFEQPAGSNTQIQFNDNNDFGATAAFTFDSAANALYVGGTTSVTGNVKAGNLTTVGAVAADTVTSYATNANLSLVPNGTGIVTIDDSNGGSTGIQLGTPTAGALVSNAVTLTTSTSVTNGIAQLNLILGKLVPPSPPNFPGGNTLSITTATSSGRMTGGFTQTDNTPGANKAVTAGNVVSVVRGSSYSTNTISNTGPGDSGTLTAYLNGNAAGNVTFNTGASPSANGTYGGNLVVTNNYDYHTANSSITAGFWYVFSAAASGIVTQGWNEIYLSDSSTGNTNTPSWYYDASSPGSPSYSNVTVTACASPSLSYSSTIPHYNSGTQFGFGFSVNKLSGDLYPNNGNLLTNSTAAGGAFQAPASVSYAAANVTVPLTRNLYVSSGAATANTTANIVASGFGSSSTGPSVTVTNSYNSTTQAFTTALANTVLYKNGTSTAIDEANVVIGSTIGTGSGNAYRIDNPGTGNTPAYTGSEAAFNSQTSTLQTYDATVVGSGSAGVLKHDQTNYSTGYLPAGPNLSSGRSGTQYFTFKFVRTAVSKFDIKYTGTIAGMWVALPGSVIDSSSSANGWIDMSVAYGGAGYPGVNAPGNGSNGCALGGTVTLNSAVTNSSKTCTFGTVSSSSTATNEIYVRIALTSGQSVTALTLQTASN